MTHISTIPFAGFYESFISTIPDDEIERDCSELSDEDGRELSKLCNEIVNYGAIYLDIAKQYVIEFQEYLKDECDLDLPSMVFESMQSPREYNFTTDKLFVTLSPEDLQRLYNECNQGDLAQVIKERFTSRSGFISFYSNDVLEWLKKPLAEYDHNEIGTLFECVILQAGKCDDFDRDMYYRLSESTSSHGDFSPYEKKYHLTSTTEAQETRLDELLNLASERG